MSTHDQDSGADDLLPEPDGDMPCNSGRFPARGRDAHQGIGSYPGVAESRRARWDHLALNGSTVLRLAREMDAELRRRESGQGRTPLPGAGERAADAELLSGIEPTLLLLARERTSARCEATPDRRGAQCTLAEAGLIRRAARAVQQALPALVVDAHIDGWPPCDIAHELLTSEGHVRRLLRQNPWRAYYRVDSYTNGSWVPAGSGTLESRGTAAQVAAAVLDGQLVRGGEAVGEAVGGAAGPGTRLRVSVWRCSGDGTQGAGEARCVTEYPPGG